MSLVDLATLYAVAGLGCAVLVFKRTRGARRHRFTSAAIALALWPLWAPLALVADPPRRTPARDRVARIEGELDRAAAAAAGSPFAVLFSPDAADRIRHELRELAHRIAELDAVLAQPGFDLAEAERRVTRLEEHASPTAVRTAVLHRDNVGRLEALRDKNARALEELGELVGALRSQLVLARYAGSSPEGVGGIVTELWARVEGLGEAMDAHEIGAERSDVVATAAEARSPVDAIELPSRSGAVDPIAKRGVT